ncbi:Ribosomal protein L11 methyltransferase [Olavius sp. associated proteobacterium Delta 1]|nr:Ribosomal protein L11 methyltransferase [Olavius sp. associated proteobacterium Delta 1]
MKWIEARVIFDHPDDTLTVDLISNLFYDFGLQGVVVDDPDLEPEEDWVEDAVGRPTTHAIIGYFHKDSQADERCKTLEEKLTQLKDKLGFFYRISYKELDDQDWAHAWKAYFWPRKISSHMVVKPTWREYQAAVDDIVIELDPGMAFGTGTHPTTALCITMIEKYLSPGDSFLDVGTGSGILMIAAAKLGAGRLCGIDKDEVAVEVAAQNLELNQVNPQVFRLTTGNLVAEITESFTFVTANIFTHVILELLQDICRVIADGGILVCSGIIAENKQSVAFAMENIGFEILETATKEDWVAIAGRLREKSKEQRA